jgi:pheromone shutdown protein TraB
MYKILIEGRNEYIANKIKEVINKYPEKNIIIFLGKGHSREIERLIR